MQTYMLCLIFSKLKTKSCRIASAALLSIFLTATVGICAELGASTCPAAPPVMIKMEQIDPLAESALQKIPSDLLGYWSAESLPLEGKITEWASTMPPYKPLLPINESKTEEIAGQRYVAIRKKNSNGFSLGTFTDPIPCKGASIVVAVRPVRSRGTVPWTSIVDVFYDRMTLGIHNYTGLVCVHVNGELKNSEVALPDQRVAILSLVVEQNGNYIVYANGVQIMSGKPLEDMTSLEPGIAGPFANAITIGRNAPDHWTTFNGNIGAVYLYAKALSPTERHQLEEMLSTKYRDLPAMGDPAAKDGKPPVPLADLKNEMERLALENNVAEEKLRQQLSVLREKTQRIQAENELALAESNKRTQLIQLAIQESQLNQQKLQVALLTLQTERAIIDIDTVKLNYQLELRDKRDRLKNLVSRKITEKIVGNYVCHQYDPNPNDWHFVSVRAMNDGTLKWTNRAGKSWRLTPTGDSDTYSLGSDCPYYEVGNTTVDVLWDENHQNVRSILFNGEAYDRATTTVK